MKSKTKTQTAEATAAVVQVQAESKPEPVNWNAPTPMSDAILRLMDTSQISMVETNHESVKAIVQLEGFGGNQIPEEKADATKPRTPNTAFDSKATFDISIMQNCFRLVKKLKKAGVEPTNVTLYTKRDAPMCLEFKIASGMETKLARFYLAPRIEND